MMEKGFGYLRLTEASANMLSPNMAVITWSLWPPLCTRQGSLEK